MTQPQSWLSGVMRWRWLGWLGSIAYGVYLLHQQMHALLFYLLWHSGDGRVRDLRHAGATLLALALTLGVCYLSWNYFEKPLVHLSHRLAADS